MDSRGATMLPTTFWECLLIVDQPSPITLLCSDARTRQLHETEPSHSAFGLLVRVYIQFRNPLRDTKAVFAETSSEAQRQPSCDRAVRPGSAAPLAHRPSVRHRSPLALRYAPALTRLYLRQCPLSGSVRLVVEPCSEKKWWILLGLGATSLMLNDFSKSGAGGWIEVVRFDGYIYTACVPKPGTDASHLALPIANCFAMLSIDNLDVVIESRKLI
jgi:hypothetical protein